MDLGVGSFVFSSGLVSFGVLKKMKQIPITERFVKAGRQALTLLILGIVRLILTKGTEYPEHVTEYGVHWNFFFTLGLMPLALAIIVSFKPEKLPYWGIIAFLGIAFELLLVPKNGMKAWVLSAPRNNLLSQNKEGIVSFIGNFLVFSVNFSNFSKTFRLPAHFFGWSWYGVNSI